MRSIAIWTSARANWAAMSRARRPNGSFSIEVARAWEQAFFGADVPRTRRIALRSAMVMSPSPGGVFATLLWLVRHGLGGRVGSGRQFVSWIHAADFIAAIDFLVAHSELQGVFNLSSPRPLPNREFMRSLM
jgi:NAD dependent epimerase/dehydratase family enzyme